MKASEIIFGIIIWLCLSLLNHITPIDINTIALAMIIGYLIEKENQQP